MRKKQKEMEGTHKKLEERKGIFMSADQHWVLEHATAEDPDGGADRLGGVPAQEEC